MLVHWTSGGEFMVARVFHDERTSVRLSSGVYCTVSIRVYAQAAHSHFKWDPILNEG